MKHLIGWISVDNVNDWLSPDANTINKFLPILAHDAIVVWIFDTDAIIIEVFPLVARINPDGVAGSIGPVPVLGGIANLTTVVGAVISAGSIGLLNLPWQAEWNIEALQSNEVIVLGVRALNASIVGILNALASGSLNLPWHASVAKAFARPELPVPIFSVCVADWARVLGVLLANTSAV